MAKRLKNKATVVKGTKDSSSRQPTGDSPGKSQPAHPLLGVPALVELRRRRDRWTAYVLGFFAGFWADAFPEEVVDGMRDGEAAFRERARS